MLYTPSSPPSPPAPPFNPPTHTRPPEVGVYCLLEVFGRVLQLVQDSVSHVRLPDAGAVVSVCNTPFLCVHFLFVARFVEVRLRHKNQALDGDQHL